MVLKLLRVPERLFSIVMWLVSFAFAAFLIGLGGKIVADLPKLETTLTVEQFVADRNQLAELRRDVQRLEREQRALNDKRAQAQLAFTGAGNAYRAAQTAHRNWLGTRSVTSDAKQDAELVRRTKELDALKARERETQVAVEEVDHALLDNTQQIAQKRQADADMMKAAQGTFQRAQFRQELPSRFCTIKNAG